MWTKIGCESGGLKLRSTRLLSVRSAVSQIRNRCHTVDLMVFPPRISHRKLSILNSPNERPLAGNNPGLSPMNQLHKSGTQDQQNEYSYPRNTFARSHPRSLDAKLSFPGLTNPYIRF